MTYHKTTSTILDLLKSHGVWFETFEHQQVRTSEEAAKIRHGYALSQGAKAMLVRVKNTNTDKRFLMLVVPGNIRFDTAKVKQLLTAKDIRFATEEEVATITDGIEPGGLPPFGNLFGLEVIVDPSLLKNEKIVFNAGDRSFSIAMKSADYQMIVSPRVETIV